MKHIDQLIANPPRPAAEAPVHGNAKPEIAHSAVALKIEAGVRKRLGPCPNVKGDRA